MTVIRFSDFAPRPPRYVEADAPPATIIVLPVVRIERNPAPEPRSRCGEARRIALLKHLTKDRKP